MQSKECWGTQPLGAGTYNTAYRSKEGRWVLKIQRRHSLFSVSDADSPERSIRLWNLINPHILPAAYTIKTELGHGWICPYIEGEQATDEEIMLTVIDIFNRTGRVIVDAIVRKNFIKKPDGEIVCIDVGLALQFEPREGETIAKSRRKSLISLETWQCEKGINRIFACQKHAFPQTINIVKALIFIKNKRPDIDEANFLKTHPSLVEKLAQAYDQHKTKDAFQYTQEALAHLDQLVYPNARKVSACISPQRHQAKAEYLVKARADNQFKNKSVSNRLFNHLSIVTTTGVTIGLSRIGAGTLFQERLKEFSPARLFGRLFNLQKQRHAISDEESNKSSAPGISA